MDFSGAINKIMPEVNSGGNEPFIIYRDTDGYHADFTQNQYGERFEWVADAMEKDPLALIYSGKDFSQGSAPFVYDTVLAARVRAEFTNETEAAVDDDETEELRALVNFFEDSVGSLSSEMTDYLATLDKPLAELYELCPSRLRTSNPNWKYSEDLASDVIYYIEREISDRLHGYPYEIEDGRHNIDGYTEKFSVALAGREVILAVDETQDVPYLVCTARRDNPLGATQYTEDSVTYDYIDAMRDFVDRVDTLLVSLEKERAAFPTIQPTLTAADCVKGGLEADLTGKVVVIKPDVLSPEYRTANHQLKIVQGGFGANPNARGNAVFCKDLHSDKETRFERYDIAGVIDPARLPQWAKDKLVEQQNEALAQTKAAPAKPKLKRAAEPDKKPSILGDLDAATAQAAERNAARQIGDKPKKRGDKEVD
jgi:hypothetical protein